MKLKRGESIKKPLDKYFENYCTAWKSKNNYAGANRLASIPFFVK
jgi:hypothetical protein